MKKFSELMEKSGDTRKPNFEIKVGQVSPNHGVQSRALESFVATLLSRCTQRSRQTAKPTEDEYARCASKRLPSTSALGQVNNARRPAHGRQEHE